MDEKTKFLPVGDPTLAVPIKLPSKRMFARVPESLDWEYSREIGLMTETLDEECSGNEDEGPADEEGRGPFRTFSGDEDGSEGSPFRRVLVTGTPFSHQDGGGGAEMIGRDWGRVLSATAPESYGIVVVVPRFDRDPCVVLRRSKRFKKRKQRQKRNKKRETNVSEHHLDAKIQGEVDEDPPGEMEIGVALRNELRCWPDEILSASDTCGRWKEFLRGSPRFIRPAPSHARKLGQDDLLVPEALLFDVLRCLRYARQTNEDAQEFLAANEHKLEELDPLRTKVWDLYTTTFGKPLRSPWRTEKGLPAPFLSPIFPPSRIEVRAFPGDFEFDFPQEALRKELNAWELHRLPCDGSGYLGKIYFEEDVVIRAAWFRPVEVRPGDVVLDLKLYIALMNALTVARRENNTLSRRCHELRNGLELLQTLKSKVADL